MGTTHFGLPFVPCSNDPYRGWEWVVVKPVIGMSENHGKDVCCRNMPMMHSRLSHDTFEAEEGKDLARVEQGSSAHAVPCRFLRALSRLAARKRRLQLVHNFQHGSFGKYTDSQRFNQN